MSEMKNEKGVLVTLDDLDAENAMLPNKVVSTIFDSLFLSGNRIVKDLSERIASNNDVERVINGGPIYSDLITKPWWNKGRELNNRPFHSINAQVYGSVVNVADRHVLDCIIALGKYIPEELARQAKLEDVLNYWIKTEKKKGIEATYDYELLSILAKQNFKRNVFSDLYVYYIVEVKSLVKLLGVALNKPNRLKLIERIDRLGLAEFRVQFLDENGNDIRVGQTAKFKLLDPNHYTFVNINSIRNKTNLTSQSFTHIVVGVGTGYIKSLRSDATINRKKFITNFVGVPQAANVTDLFKYLNTHKSSFLAGKSLKKQITIYYNQKAEQGSQKITTKVNKTFIEFIKPVTINKLEECLGLSLDLIIDDKGRVTDATFYIHNLDRK